jgi:hypothetical protein
MDYAKNYVNFANQSYSSILISKYADSSNTVPTDTTKISGF